MQNDIKKPTTTIQEIAEKLNISASTVSRALNNNPRISEKTKTLVFQTAIAMGYQQGLVFSESEQKNLKILAIVLPDFENSMYNEAVKAIQIKAIANGFSTMVFLSNHSPSIEFEIIRKIIEMKVSGVAISLSYKTQNDEMVKQLINSGIPLVMFNRVFHHLSVRRVIFDNFQTGFKAVEHLASVGCKKIAFLSGHPECQIVQEREKGYRSALSKSGLAYESKYLLYSDLTLTDISRSIEYLYSLSSPPDAIIASNNIIALQVISLLKNLGLNVPADVAVLGIGHDSFQAFISPTLSSLQLPGNLIGNKVASLLFQQINDSGEKYTAQTQIIPPKLIIRNSTMKYGY